MKKTTFICFLICAATLFSSCTSVYVNPPETLVDLDQTAPIKVDLEGEYFTEGKIDLMGTASKGYYYKGAWIYPELQWGVVQEDTDGFTYYNEKQIKRLVKYNPYTGEISSLCLNPTCNHSPGSDCLMIVSEVRGTAAIQTYLNSYTVYDDWLILVMGHHHPDYGLLKYTEFYNLKTGESKSEFTPEVGDFVMNIWDGGSYYDGKLYKIKKTLDYSTTGYIPGGDVSASKFTPDTVFTLCEFDLKTHKLKELFEVPNYYGLQTISNKRFYFAGLEDDYYYSCTRDGKDFRREDVRTISTSEYIGTYVFEYSNEGYTYYDLVTNTQKEVIPDFKLHSKPIVTEEGVFYSTYTTIDEVIKYQEENATIHPSSFQNGLKKIMYKGTAQIWKSDFEGNHFELVYEKNNAVLTVIFADENYLYVECQTATTGGTDQNNGRAVINIKSGEMTMVPYLEMIIPPDYVSSEGEDG